ncbi:hypothetical protein AGMMS50239_19870 [Bacteroidia bacterium]|nr:hypothetical protein AGMMS50239_19870 [Bacteroidia bacterium]
MAKLEGIIYRTFDKYVVLRGFAPIGELANVSKRPEAYQRIANDEHKRDIVKFLKGIDYTYFPDVILACRTNQYADLLASVADDKDVDSVDATFVNGLRVLKQRLPYSGYRARHAFLELEPKTIDEKLPRVDGNHRLEPFSSNIEWWYPFVDIPDEIKNESDKEKKDGWIKHQAREYKKPLSKNVYHEIGYAMGVSEAAGIKPPIILLYKTTSTHRDKNISEDHFVGFNLRGLSQLRFSNYDELANGIMERLKKHFEL